MAFGTIMHFVLLEIFEQSYHNGDSFETAKRAAIESFKTYWAPSGLEVVTEPITIWLRGQNYADLYDRGIEGIEWYTEMVRKDDSELLATELSFQVPIVDTWDPVLEEPHILVGTIDKLRASYFRRALTLDVADAKSGATKTALRHNVQFTAYSYATTRRELWCGWNGEDGFGEERGQYLFDRFRNAPRRGTWVSLKDRKNHDAGFRGELDYTRFKVAVTAMAASIQADIFPLSIGSENCELCPARTMCAGVGLPPSDHGSP